MALKKKKNFATEDTETQRRGGNETAALSQAEEKTDFNKKMEVIG